MAQRPRKAPLEFTGQAYGSGGGRNALNDAGSAGPGPGASTPPATDMAAMIAALSAEDSTPITPSISGPGHPMTSGLPIGPGPGPEALPPRALGPQQPERRVDVEAMAAQLPMLEILANQPGASRELRVLYRRLRSQMPADVHVMPAGSREG